MTAADPLLILLRSWEVFAQALAKGYEFGLDDWLNDVDLRQFLADALQKAERPWDAACGQRLVDADQAVRSATSVMTTCLWGSRNAAEHGWQPDQNWWYFVVPTQHTPEFVADLSLVR